jgi:hypothetical protein
VPHSVSPADAADFRAWPWRGLDALLYSSVWLAAAAAVQTAATLHLWPHVEAVGYRLVLMVFAATLLVYNLDAALPFKHRQPAGTSARKAWQQRHRRLLAGLAVVSALVAAGLFFRDAWWRFLPKLLPLAALALLYSWPLLRWRGRRRALREVPLLKVFVIAGVWALVTVGLPVLALHRPLAEVGGLLAQRFFLVLALAIVFDIRDYSRDRRAGTRTFPGVLGVPGARRVALAFLAVSVGLGLSRGAPLLAVLLPAVLTAVVISLAEEERSDYYYALLTDGVLLVQAVAYFVF